jgi:hypothetical protein
MQAGKADKQPPTHATGGTAHADICVWELFTTGSLVSCGEFRCISSNGLQWLGKLYIETAQHAKQVSSVTLTRPLHSRLGTHAKLSPPTVMLWPPWGGPPGPGVIICFVCLHAPSSTDKFLTHSQIIMSTCSRVTSFFVASCVCRPMLTPWGPQGALSHSEGMFKSQTADI